MIQRGTISRRNQEPPVLCWTPTEFYNFYKLLISHLLTGHNRSKLWCFSGTAYWLSSQIAKWFQAVILSFAQNGKEVSNILLIGDCLRSGPMLVWAYGPKYLWKLNKIGIESTKIRAGILLEKPTKILSQMSVPKVHCHGRRKTKMSTLPIQVPWFHRSVD